MTTLHRGLGVLVIFSSIAAPAAADEVAYLTYLKGTEGKTAPFRVLWNEVDDANARITIDLGTPYQAWLKKLGLARVLKYDARRNRKEFVVRDPQFTRFVKIVATDFVPGLQQAIPLASGAAAPADAEVQGAVLLISPAPDKAQLEVIARLHVTYLMPQKSGPPVVKDLVNGDLIFLGQPEPKGPNQKSR
jgi:hypothetical protein